MQWTAHKYMSEKIDLYIEMAITESTKKMLLNTQSQTLDVWGRFAPVQLTEDKFPSPSGKKLYCRGTSLKANVIF